MEINHFKNVKKYTIDYKIAYSYFIDHIGCGKELSQRVVKNICFGKGRFFTFLPKNAIIERLHKLHFGGIIPTNLYDAKGKLIGPTPPGSNIHSDVKTIQILSTFIKTYLSQSPSHFAVIEDYIEKTSSSFDHLENTRMIPYKDEVYYFLNSNNSIKEIKTMVLISEQVWHSLFILTSIRSNLNSELSEQNLNHIIKNISFIIVSAYDGEGYVFWGKNQQDSKKYEEGF